MRTIDIAHSRQTVLEAIGQLRTEIKKAQRAGEDALLVVHGYGASGSGGAIKEALATELPNFARLFRFKAYGYADKDRLPEGLRADRRLLSLGSTLLVFRQDGRDNKSTQDFRPNFRSMRTRVIVRASASRAALEPCRHIKSQLISRGPNGSKRKCRQCGKIFLTPSQC